MKTTIYTNPFNRTGIIAKEVEVLKLSTKPKIKKNGDLYKRPFSSGLHSDYEESILINLWKLGIMKADVKYPDGTVDNNVFVNIKDLNL